MFLNFFSVFFSHCFSLFSCSSFLLFLFALIHLLFLLLPFPCLLFEFFFGSIQTRLHFVKKKIQIKIPYIFICVACSLVISITRWNETFNFKYKKVGEMVISVFFRTSRSVPTISAVKEHCCCILMTPSCCSGLVRHACNAPFNRL